ncbi:MAG TPA: hypothetical protein VHC40_13320 [Rhizomicrobium sp.]|jgi:hypothetical protein|nr:hypothetical protein [Rhizomicrobium sp.]
MTEGWIAFGVIACLFGMIALLPSFDGKWEATGRAAGKRDRPDGNWRNGN